MQREKKRNERRACSSQIQQSANQRRTDHGFRIGGKKKHGCREEREERSTGESKLSTSHIYVSQLNESTVLSLNVS